MISSGAVVVIFTIWLFSINGNFLYKCFVHILIGAFLFLNNMYLLSLMSLACGVLVEVVEAQYSSVIIKKVNFNNKSVYFKCMIILLATGMISFLMYFRDELVFGEVILSSKDFLLPVILITSSLLIRFRRETSKN
jgi:hypothetical protein